MKNSSLMLTLEYPPQVGGVATYYANLAVMEKHMLVLLLQSHNTPFFWLTYLPRILFAILQHRPKELHIGQILPLGYYGLICKWILRLPYFTYLHGLDVNSAKLTQWKKSWIRRILQNSEKIICNSHFVKNSTQANHRISELKFSVRYPVVEAKRIQDQSQLAAPIAHDMHKKIILSVGRLVKRKGFDNVVVALDVLKRKKVPYEFEYWIIGNGSYQKKIEETIMHCGLQNEVKILNDIARPALWGYFEACTLFIMTSYEIDGDVEGFGIVFLEAGLFKKPVIGGRSGGVPEAVHDGITGLLVDPKNIQEIANAIDKILSTENFSHTLGMHGYERVIREFSIP